MNAKFSTELIVRNLRILIIIILLYSKGTISVVFNMLPASEPDSPINEDTIRSLTINYYSIDLHS